MYLYPYSIFFNSKIPIQHENYRHSIGSFPLYTIILSKKGLMQLVKMPSIQDF